MLNYILRFRPELLQTIIALRFFAAATAVGRRQLVLTQKSDAGTLHPTTGGGGAMIVEFTGCSGSGKTSLARRVHRLLRAQRCADAPISRCLPATTFSHLSTELLGWPWLLVARRRHSVCDGLVRRSIREVSLSRGEWLRLLRSWNRKLAMMGGYRTSVIGSAVSLQDEGPIHFAMTLFARWPFCTTDKLNRYLDHVPLPDRVVCVRLARTMRGSSRQTSRPTGTGS